MFEAPSYYHKIADPGEWETTDYIPEIKKAARSTGRLELSVYSRYGTQAWAYLKLELEVQYSTLSGGVTHFSSPHNELVPLSSNWQIRLSPELSLAECYLLNIAVWLSRQAISGESVREAVHSVIYDMIKKDNFLQEDLSKYWPKLRYHLGLEKEGEDAGTNDAE